MENNLINVKYKTFNNSVPDDYYEVIKICQDIDGTIINLEGEKNRINIEFGSIACLNICDEGSRIESYNQISDIQRYRKNSFFGNPIYIVENSLFKKWLEKESCGFSNNLIHLSIITLNHFIDIAVAFPPSINIEKK